MTRNITIRDLYLAAEKEGMLDSEIVVTGCGVEWDFRLDNFKIDKENNCVKVW